MLITVDDQTRISELLTQTDHVDLREFLDELELKVVNYGLHSLSDIHHQDVSDVLEFMYQRIQYLQNGGHDADPNFPF
jgi:predicted component of type VI protein secretion system